MTRPKLTWAEFLAAAPYFQTLPRTAVRSLTRAQTLDPEVRAALYFDVFNGQVSNGGVAQYFFNVALDLPGFEHVPEYIAANPVFTPIVGIVRAVHDAWDGCSADVAKARAKGGWPTSLFAKTAPMFEKLQSDYLGVKHRVEQRLCQDIVLRPQTYFDMRPVDGVSDSGVAHVVLDDGAMHLRFVDGFPMGPNIVEGHRGACRTVTFTAERSVLECTDGPMQHLIHYPSQRSVSLAYGVTALSSLKTSIALTQNDGLQEFFERDGTISRSALVQDGQDVSVTKYGVKGARSWTTLAQSDGELFTRYWPDGAVNVSYVRGPDGVVRYGPCLDEAGVELAPGGTGELYEFLSEDDTRRVWRTGTLEGGLLVGDLTRHIKEVGSATVISTPM